MWSFFGPPISSAAEGTEQVTNNVKTVDQTLSKSLSTPFTITGDSEADSEDPIQIIIKNSILGDDNGEDSIKILTFGEYDVVTYLLAEISCDDSGLETRDVFATSLLAEISRDEPLLEARHAFVADNETCKRESGKPGFDESREDSSADPGTTPAASRSIPLTDISVTPSGSTEVVTTILPPPRIAIQGEARKEPSQKASVSRELTQRTPKNKNKTRAKKPAVKQFLPPSQIVATSESAKKTTVSMPVTFTTTNSGSTEIFPNPTVTIGNSPNTKKTNKKTAIFDSPKSPVVSKKPPASTASDSLVHVASNEETGMTVQNSPKQMSSLGKTSPSGSLGPSPSNSTEKNDSTSLALQSTPESAQYSSADTSGYIISKQVGGATNLVFYIFVTPTGSIEVAESNPIIVGKPGDPADDKKGFQTRWSSYRRFFGASRSSVVALKRWPSFSSKRSLLQTLSFSNVTRHRPTSEIPSKTKMIENTFGTQFESKPILTYGNLESMETIVSERSSDDQVVSITTCGPENLGELPIAKESSEKSADIREVERLGDKCQSRVVVPPRMDMESTNQNGDVQVSGAATEVFDPSVKCVDSQACQVPGIFCFPLERGMAADETAFKYPKDALHTHGETIESNMLCNDNNPTAE